MDSIILRLLALGARDRSPSPRVRLFTLEEGSRVVLVPDTGRIQLRLSPESDPERRTEEAWSLARRILGFTEAGFAEGRGDDTE
jgi:hypothetical protein